MSILELLLLFIAITVPLGWYTVVGWRRDSVSRTVAEFFIFDKKLNEHYFVQTSVAYAFQVAAIFLFADWGFRYGIGGFWVPLFWGLGYFLLIRFVDRMESFTKGSWTLHGFLRNSFGDSKALQSTAAILTIVGLSGTMVVEADYASYIFSIFNEEATFRYAVGIFLAVFCLVYVLSGGYKAAVLTDEKQLPLAYVSLILVILFTLLLTFENGFTSAFWWLNILLILLFVLMFWRKGGLDALRKREDRTIFVPIFGLAIVALACVLSFFTIQKDAQPNDLTSLSLFATPLAQGPILLFSLFLANFFWMLVDISTWQRIASISVDTSEQDTHKRLQPIRKGLVKIMWESPISWGLGAIFGMSLRYTGLFNNVDQASSNISMFVTGLATGQIQSSILGAYSFFVLPLFFAAVIAIMLSTIDSYLSAVTFTAMYDLPPYRDRLHQRLDEISAQPIEQSSKFLNAARFYTVLITILAVGFYYYLSILTEGYVVTYLYVFYSAQLSLLPSVVHALLRKRINKHAALTSLIIGFSVSVYTGVEVSTMEAEYSVLTPLLCLISAFVSYYLVYFLRKDG